MVFKPQIYMRKAAFCTKPFFHYETPPYYKESFFLANAPLCDCINWFVHRAYEFVFPDLADELLKREPSYSHSHVITKMHSIIQAFEPCNTFVEVVYPLRREFGDISLVKGLRAQHGGGRDGMVCLGGLRIQPDVNADVVKAMATLSTYRYACFGIDMCGSHGGIVLDPAVYSNEERKSFLQGYAKELVKINCCGELIDVIKPDINTTSDDMTCIATAIGPESPAGLLCVGGRDLNESNYYDYCDTISHCAKAGLEQFLHHKTILDALQITEGLQNKTFILEGLGRVGSNMARILESSGAKLIGVKEQNEWVYWPDGINVEDIVEYKRSNGSIAGYNSKTKPTKSERLFAEKCDMIVLTAYHKTMHSHVANNVQAKIIVEIANGAVTPLAHKTLVGYGKLVIPDIYIGCGSALMAHFEYMKNVQKAETFVKSMTSELFTGVLDEVKEKAMVVVGGGGGGGSMVQQSGRSELFREPKLLTTAIENITKKIGQDIMDVAETYKLSMDYRTAAYIKALKNIYNIIYENRKY